jgi:hypothetical protein
MRKKLLIAIPVLLVIVAIGGAVWWFVNDAARAAVDRHLANLVEGGGYQELEYEDLTVHPNGDVTMTNLHVVQEPFEYTLQDIRLSNFDYTSEFPRHLDVAIRGVDFEEIDPATAEPQVAALVALLNDMNFAGTVPLEIDYSLRYDPDNAHEMDTTVRVAIPDSFALDATNLTRNLPPSAFAMMSQLDQQDPVQAQAQVMALLAEVEVPSMRLSLLDEGFLDGIIASAAAENGASPADFRNLLISQTRNAYLFLPQNAQGVGMTIGAELAEFLEGGKTVTVTIEPEYGGKLQQLQAEVMGAVFTGNFAQVVDLLHLEVVTE